MSDDASRLNLCPISFGEACEFVRRKHRHHKAPVGMKFTVAVEAGGKLVGVAIVSRPVARMFDDGWTLEVSRSCTDGFPNANSMLYGAAWRAAKALGYRRLITYTLASESGSSLRAAGWRIVAERRARPGWDMPSRPRADDSTAHNVQRTLWEAS
ncbi:XF1762 family protein [Mycobacterium sp. NPDC049093]